MLLKAAVPEVVMQQRQHGVRRLGEPQLYGGFVAVTTQAGAENHLNQLVCQMDVLHL